jgi:signal transduction histidine kinase
MRSWSAAWQRWRDPLLAAVLLGWMELANLGQPPSPALPLLAVPLAWRRRWPTAVAGAAALGTVLAVATPLNASAALPVVLAVLVAAFSVAAYGRWPWVGLVVLSVPLVPIADAQFELPLPLWTQPFAIVGAAWLAGALVRRRADAAQAWRERALRIEGEQEAARAAALAEERARIARDLHDIVSHRVGLMVIQGGAARTVLRTQPEVAVAQLQALEAGGREALAELRGLLGLLAPTMPGEPHEEPADPAPRLERLDQLVAQTRAAGLPVRLEITGEPRPLPDRVELAAYRIVQEALTNSLRHSARTGSAVTVHYGPDELALAVLDDGPPPPRAESAAGRGLVGMRERAALCGGSMTAGAAPGDGFAVRVRLPLDRPA